MFNCYCILQVLDLHNNEIKSLPNEITELRSLQVSLFCGFIHISLYELSVFLVLSIQSMNSSTSPTALASGFGCKTNRNSKVCNEIFFVFPYFVSYRACSDFESVHALLYKFTCLGYNDHPSISTVTTGASMACEHIYSSSSINNFLKLYPLYGSSILKAILHVITWLSPFVSLSRQEIVKRYEFYKRGNKLVSLTTSQLSIYYATFQTIMNCELKCQKDYQHFFISIRYLLVRNDELCEAAAYPFVPTVTGYAKCTA